MTTRPAGAPRPTADSITDDALDALLEDRQRLAAYIAQLRKTSVEDVLAEARRQADEERYRVTPEDIARAFDVPMPPSGPAGASFAPREHCGHIPPPIGHEPRVSECVLRPGHSGSHADERGMRWWLRTDEDAGASDASRRAALAVIRRALEELPAQCRYHGADMAPDRLGLRYGRDSCCDTGRPARLRQLALEQLDAVGGALENAEGKQK